VARNAAVAAVHCMHSTSTRLLLNLEMFFKKHPSLCSGI
jgi:hypothetical protein